MSYSVGQPIRDGFDLIDNANQPVTGIANGSARWTTKTAKLLSTPATTATLTITEDAGGAYADVFTPSVVGDWRVSIVYDDGAGLVRRFTETYSVVSAAQFDPLGQDVSGYGANTAGGKLARIGSRAATVDAPMLDSGNLTIQQGDDYLIADSRHLSWDVDASPDLSGATVTWKLIDSAGTTVLTKTATVVNAGTATQTCKVELTRVNTAALTPHGAKQYLYDLQAALATSGDIVTLAQGAVAVRKDR